MQRSHHTVRRWAHSKRPKQATFTAELPPGGQTLPFPGPQVLPAEGVISPVCQDIQRAQWPCSPGTQAVGVDLLGPDPRAPGPPFLSPHPTLSVSAPYSLCVSLGSRHTGPASLCSAAPASPWTLNGNLGGRRHTHLVHFEPPAPDQRHAQGCPRHRATLVACLCSGQVKQKCTLPLLLAAALLWPSRAPFPWYHLLWGWLPDCPHTSS